MTDSPPDTSGNDEPHDVLAAEEFAIPGQEPGVPRDPNPKAHDVLAAEEFAMPAPPGSRGGGGSLARVAAVGAALAGLVLLLRGRARRLRRR
jgi:hypothetical protein